MANIEVDGPNKTIKVDSGDLTLDIPGDIILDADGANVTFKDGGTSVLDLSNSSTDAVLTVSTQDKDLIIKGDDNGSAITAATFDMSDAGTLALNHDLRIADAGYIGSASDADAIAIAANGVVTFSQNPVFPDGGVAVADLDIDGATDIGAAIVDADLFIVDDGAGGTNRKTAASRLKTYVSGGLTKLASTDVSSGTAAIIFNSSVVTAYDNYLIVLNGIKTASSAANGTILLSSDNGSNFIGSSRFCSDFKDLTNGTVGSAHTGTFSHDSVTNPVMWDNHTTEPLNGHFYFYNCNPTTDNTYSVHCGYKSSYTNQNGVEYQQDGGVMYDVTAGQQINYFKVLNAAQNIDEGRATLYGFNT